MSLLLLLLLKNTKKQFDPIWPMNATTWSKIMQSEPDQHGSHILSEFAETLLQFLRNEKTIIVLPLVILTCTSYKCWMLYKLNKDRRFVCDNNKSYVSCPMKHQSPTKYRVKQITGQTNWKKNRKSPTDLHNNSMVSMFAMFMNNWKKNVLLILVFLLEK